MQASRRPQVWIEAWSPDYGTSFDSPGLDSSIEQVSPYVETPDWAPISPELDRLPPVAFVDGVVRVDSRAFAATEQGLALGLCASVGVGSVVSSGRGASFGPAEVQRSAIFGSGAEFTLPGAPGGVCYQPRSVSGSGPESLLAELSAVRDHAEVEMSRRLAIGGYLVIADGPLRTRREHLEIVGLIKSHHKTYLSPELEPVIGRLRAGERSPLFAFGDVRPRYGWYLRLAAMEGEHPWAGIARCECSASLSLQRAVQLADLTAAHLPRFGSRSFWDPRAPQNLVPIAALEHRLWHLLGDRQIVFRQLRSAMANQK